MESLFNQNLTYRYCFDFDDGSTKNFEVQLDVSSLQLQNSGNSYDYPDWCKLDFYQCPNCPLSAKEITYCPVAVNVIDVVEYFKSLLSYESANVTIETNERTYVKRSAVQDALSSLLGIIMVTSGCPILDRLRPLVRTHLPFATAHENLYRVMAMYFTAQFFRQKNDLPPDWDLKGVVKMYDQIKLINQSFAKRISSQIDKDANINALVILNCLAEFASIVIENDLLEDIEKNFSAYLLDAKG